MPIWIRSGPVGAADPEAERRTFGDEGDALPRLSAGVAPDRTPGASAMYIDELVALRSAVKLTRSMLTMVGLPPQAKAFLCAGHR